MKIFYRGTWKVNNILYLISYILYLLHKNTFQSSFLFLLKSDFGYSIVVIGSSDRIAGRQHQILVYTTHKQRENKVNQSDYWHDGRKVLIKSSIDFITPYAGQQYYLIDNLHRICEKSKRNLYFKHWMFFLLMFLKAYWLLFRARQTNI